MTARSIRMMLFVLTMFAGALATRSAFAQACTNDIDCTANTACGGDVCDWNVAPLMTCKPAGGSAKEHDGWCTADTDCKCYAQGARCLSTTTFSCTFTRPCEADGGTCTGGGGGSSGTGTAGTSGGGGGGGGGCSVAGDGAGNWSLLLAAFGLVVALRARRRR